MYNANELMKAVILGYVGATDNIPPVHYVCDQTGVGQAEAKRQIREHIRRYTKHVDDDIYELKPGVTY